MGLEVVVVVEWTKNLKNTRIEITALPRKREVEGRDARRRYVTLSAPDASHRLPPDLQCGHLRSSKITLDFKSAYEKKTRFV